MTESNKIISNIELSSLAGKARAAKLSPERRSEIARLAGSSKGKKGLPRATHGGVINIGNNKIECGVLPDRTRVISCASIRNALGLSKPGPEMRRKSEVSKLPTFMLSENLSPYFLEVFEGRLPIIDYVNKSGSKTTGIEATALPKICEVYLKARDSGALTKPQFPISITAEIIIRSLAQVGIISLVDESSGYQEERARDELQTLLKKFINEDLLKWTQKFPHSFFRETYRILGWKYREGQCHGPSYLGKFINKYIYDAISSEVKTELENRNPILEETGKRSACFHQYLTPDIGIPALDRHLCTVITLLKLSKTKDDFHELFKKLFNENENNQIDWIEEK